MTRSRWTASDMPVARRPQRRRDRRQQRPRPASPRASSPAPARTSCSRCATPTGASAAAASIAGSTEVRRLDLADLASIRAFAETLGSRASTCSSTTPASWPCPKAGRRTASSCRSARITSATSRSPNLLLAQITDRVVTVSSFAHRTGRIRLDDLNWERGRYGRWTAYGQSKLANLLFTLELQRRLDDAGSPVRRRRRPSGLCRARACRGTPAAGCRTGSCPSRTA